MSGSYIDVNITLRSERLNFKNSSFNENLKIDFIIEGASKYINLLYTIKFIIRNTKDIPTMKLYDKL